MTKKWENREVAYIVDQEGTETFGVDNAKKEQKIRALVDAKMQRLKVEVDKNEVMLKIPFLHNHRGLKASFVNLKDLYAMMERFQQNKTNKCGTTD